MLLIFGVPAGSKSRLDLSATAAIPGVDDRSAIDSDQEFQYVEEWTHDTPRMVR